MRKVELVVRTRMLPKTNPATQETLDLAIENAARKLDEVLEKQRAEMEKGTYVEEITEWK